VTATNDTVGLVAEVDFAGRQSVGMRANQQDAYGVVPPEDLNGGRTLLAIVADGMGGHAAGEIASETALQAFVDGFFSDALSDDGSRLWAGLELANERIREVVAQRPTLHGMGTTVIAALFRNDTIRWISVGDSPLYLFREGILRRLNKLHVDFPEGVEEVVVAAPHVALASAIIGERLFEVDDADPFPLVSGDLLILASDGLNTLSESELLTCLKSDPSATAATHADALLRAVESHHLPRQDNTTVIVIRWR
jgi:serine/threonine protein phosphatase PrpC